MPGFYFQRLDGRDAPSDPTGPRGQRVEAPQVKCKGCVLGELRRLSLAREVCLFVFGAAVGFIICMGVTWQ